MSGVVVIIAESVPSACHGVVSRYLMRVGTGIYVGTLTPRVRDALWIQAQEFRGRGEMTMIYPSATPQGFTVLGAGKLPKWLVDFDGLTFLKQRLSHDDALQLQRLSYEM